MGAKGVPYTQAVWLAVSEAEEPMTLAGLVSAVMAMPVRYSPDPVQTIRGALWRSLLVARTEDNRFASVLWLLKGTTFRHVLSETDIVEGSLRLGTDVCYALSPFVFAPRTQQQPRSCHLYFEQGPLLSRPILRFNGEALGIPPAPSLAEWFEFMRCEPGDSLMFEVTDGEEGIYHVFFQRQAEQDAQEVSRRNQQLAEEARRVLARKRVPCPISWLMPPLIGRAVYRNPCPPLPLETVLRDVPMFELKGRRVRLLPHSPGAMEYLPGLGPSPAGASGTGLMRDLLHRLFRRGR